MIVATPSAARARNLKDTIGRALRSLPDQGTRAFALEGLTCIVEWRPAPSTGFHVVRLSLRRGARSREHSATIGDLTLLPRTVEHHLLQFDREEATMAAPKFAMGGRR